jgi:O-methyltransferase involved in polyketide biosynthesis
MTTREVAGVAGVAGAGRSGQGPSVARHTVQLGPVPETLLIPLYARATETGKPDPLLRDPKAVEMVAAIDYDFTPFQGADSLVGACLRATVFDAWVRAFLEQHPRGIVVDIGAGLDTRFERVHNGRVRWFDLDLPDAMALRRRFFADAPRRTSIAASVLDESWIGAVAQGGQGDGQGPYFFVAEAVLPFLTEGQVRTVLALLARHFPGCRFAFDSCSRLWVERQDQHDVLRHVSARMRWACDDPRTIEDWDGAYHLEASRALLDVTPEEGRRLPPGMYQGLQQLPPQVRDSYRLNRFRLGAP